MSGSLFKRKIENARKIIINIHGIEISLFIDEPPFQSGKVATNVPSICFPLEYLASIVFMNKCRSGLKFNNKNCKIANKKTKGHDLI
jgi:hypothetical protein